MSFLERFEIKNNSIDTIPNSITNFFKGKRRIVVFWVFFGIFSLLALTIRYLSLSAISEDMEEIFTWYDFIAANGGFAALKNTSISDYTPPYLFFLAIATCFPWISKLIAIKLISIIFDFLCAFGIFNIVKHFSSSWVAWLAYFCVLFSPVVWVNSAYWGQSDAIYTSFLFFSIHNFLKKRSIPGMIFFSIAFSFKLQAVFLVPFLLTIFIAMEHRWHLFLIVPIVLFVMFLPAVIAGQPVSSVFIIYFFQANYYLWLSANAPSMYGSLNFVSDHPQYEMIGYILLAAFMCGLSLVAFKKRGKLGDKEIILLASLSLLLTPFLLPRMHERYFYPAAVASIILLFTIPRLWMVTLYINITAYFSYFHFLWDSMPIPLPLLSFMNLIAIVTLLLFFLKLTFQKNIIMRVEEVKDG